MLPNFSPGLCPISKFWLQFIGFIFLWYYFNTPRKKCILSQLVLWGCLSRFQHVQLVTQKLLFFFWCWSIERDQNLYLDYLPIWHMSMCHFADEWGWLRTNRKDVLWCALPTPSALLAANLEGNVAMHFPARSEWVDTVVNSPVFRLRCRVNYGAHVTFSVSHQSGMWLCVKKVIRRQVKRHPTGSTSDCARSSTKYPGNVPNFSSQQALRSLWWYPPHSSFGATWCLGSSCRMLQTNVSKRCCRSYLFFREHTLEIPQLYLGLQFASMFQNV